MKRAFVTGWPVSHSLSPALHGFWLENYRINGSYEALPVEPSNFSAFLKNLVSSDFVGGNITLPHKEVAFQTLKNLDAEAKAIGAVNTIWLDQEGEVQGGNTDAYGFAANMDECAPQWRDGKRALVLGAGGASRAIIHALRQVEYREIFILNRTVQKAKSLAEKFGSACQFDDWNAAGEYVSGADIIINTTSVGMKGQDELAMPELTAAKQSAVVTDIVYTPLMTSFLQAADKLGLKTVDGLGMLLHQAVPGFEKWFGIRPQVTGALRKFVLEQLP